MTTGAEIFALAVALLPGSSVEPETKTEAAPLGVARDLSPEEIQSLVSPSTSRDVWKLAALIFVVGAMAALISFLH